MKKEIQKKKKVLSNVILVHLKENKHKNLINCNFYAINNDKSIIVYSKNKEL